MSQLVIGATRSAPRSFATLLKSAAGCVQLTITLVLLSASLLPAALATRACLDRFGLVAVIVVSPFAYALWGVSFCLLFAAVKQCVFRRTPLGTYPYFSATVARWAFVTQLSKVASQLFLFWVMGTDVLVWWYRLLGAKIGDRVTVNTVFVYDWDRLEIGDDSFIGGRTTLMAHVGQMGHVTFTPTRIGAHCTVGQDSTVLPGVIVEDGAVLGANSLALEGQRLEAGKVYLGVPARYVRKRPGLERGDEPDAPPTSPGVTFLDRNESPYPPAPACLAALRQAGVEKVSRYARDDSLRSRLSGWTGVSAERITLGAGAEGLLKAAFRGLLRHGDSVLVPDPSWCYYEQLASQIGASARRYALREGATGFYCEADEIVDAARSNRAALVVLASPNNPTGNSLSADAIVHVLESLPQTPVVLDEAYWGYRTTSNAELRMLHARFPHLLVIRSFSKFFGLPGIRLGFAVSGAGLASFEAAAGVYLGHNRIAEDVAGAALGDIGYYEARAACLAAERARFASALLGARGVRLYESDANFVLLRFTGGGRRDFEEHLRRAGYAAKFFSAPPLEDCARVSLGTPEQNRVVLDCLEATERSRGVR